MRTTLANVITVLAGLLCAVLWLNVEASDPERYALSTIGLAFVALPVLAGCGAIAAVYTNNIFAQLLGKIAVFGLTVVAVVTIFA